MAAPITHIVLANKVFNKYFSDKDKADFYRGTVFPDVRYLGGIRRSETHFEDVTFFDVKKEDSFFAGFKLHSLIDRIRERFIHKQNIYSFLPASRHIVEAVKLIEDRLLYSKVKDWKSVKDYLNNYSKEEFSFKVNRNEIEKWHGLLRIYFDKEPKVENTIEFLSKLKGFKGSLGELKFLMDRLDSNPKIREMVFKFYREFEILLEKEV